MQYTENSSKSSKIGFKNWKTKSKKSNVSVGLPTPGVETVDHLYCTGVYRDTLENRKHLSQGFPAKKATMRPYPETWTCFSSPSEWKQTLEAEFIFTCDGNSLSKNNKRGEIHFFLKKNPQSHKDIGDALKKSCDFPLNFSQTLENKLTASG